MFKNNFKSHLLFAKSEHGGILLFIILIIVFVSGNVFFDNSVEATLDISSPEVLLKQKILDSLYSAEMQARKPKIYPFNPNFISDYKAYTLGMPTEAFDKLQHYRKLDKWINNVSDFKKVTGVSEVWLDSISPYFKFPDWVTNPKRTKTAAYKDVTSEKSFDKKIDLNSATAQQLQQVSGIGVVLSERIIAYRNSLNGFTDNVQLYEVYGISAEVIPRVKKLFTVKTPKVLVKLNVNTASASDLSTIPGVSFDLGKKIWEFVKLREGIVSLTELEKIEGVTANKIERIKLYLFAE